MTIPASSVPAVLLALYNAVVTQINDTSVLVQFGVPGTWQPNDMIAIGLNIDKESVPYNMVGSGGAGWIDETFTVEVEIDVFRGGTDQLTAFQRACTLEYAVDQVVRGDPTIGGTTVVAYPTGCSYQLDTEDEHKGSRVTALKRIHCHTRT